MRPASFLLAGAAVFVVLALAPARGETDTAKHAAEARALVKSFAGRLKGELVSALESGGATQAVTVCNAAAPAIAKATSEESDWEVARTSLRLRNPDNAPDDWERRALARFEARKAEGADAKTLEHFEVTQRNGKRVFRYMKAIPTAKPCLTCHGPSLEPGLAAHLAKLYPSDEATGFALGDIRGAFTLVRSLQD